jgi:HK97 family phage major capsid protein
MNSTLTAQTSTAGICYFGDLSMAAMLGVRRGITLRASAERYFEYDQLAIQGTERFDIAVHGVGTASVPGPIIMLVFPGS